MAIRVALDGPLRLAKKRDKGWSITGNFHRHIFRYCTGKRWREMTSDYFLAEWQRRAFWELVRDWLEDRIRPTDDQWKACIGAFSEVMERINPRPDLVFVLGVGGRNNFRNPDALSPCEHDAGDNLFHYGSSHVLFVKHPAARPNNQKSTKSPRGKERKGSDLRALAI